MYDYMNVYSPTGQAVILAAPVARGGHCAVLLAAKLKHGLVNPGYAIYQTRGQAEGAPPRGLEVPCVRGRAKRQ